MVRKGVGGKEEEKNLGERGRKGEGECESNPAVTDRKKEKAVKYKGRR